MRSAQPKWLVGVARRKITPTIPVELAGLGYYLERTWQRVRDDLTATALVITDANGHSVAFVALDLMYNDAGFTQAIRRQAAARCGLLPEEICVNCSHSHNAPTAGFIRGAGEQNQDYLTFAAREAAAALVEAWQARQPAHLSVGRQEITGLTFNRTRERGPVDTRLTLLRADSLEGKPLAAAINFHSHCIAHMEIDLQAISRDWPGEVVDQIEAQLPGVTALYLQGTCGDVNVERKYNGTPLRFEPARRIVAAAHLAWTGARGLEGNSLSVASREISIPTRRWIREEIQRDREEALYRRETGDIKGWLEGFARAAVNQPARLPLRYGGSVEKAVAALSRFAIEWTDEILPVFDSRAEEVKMEIQAARIGDLYFAMNPSELFTTFGLELREKCRAKDLMVLGYSNGSIGYLPDAEEISRGGYAATQSPKFTGQFPFVPASGATLVNETLALLEQRD